QTRNLVLGFEMLDLIQFKQSSDDYVKRIIFSTPKNSSTCVEVLESLM
ncbi:25060_t:CDS:1, partial [Gigaspora rosea]